MEIDQIKEKVAEAGGSIPVLEKKAKALEDKHAYYKENRQLAYIVAASELGVKISTYTPKTDPISEEQIQDEGQYLSANEIMATDLRVVNIRGYVINAPRGEESVKQTPWGDPVVYLSLRDDTGEFFLSALDDAPRTFLVDEKMEFLTPIILKQALITISKDGRKFMRITDNTEILPNEKLSFGLDSVKVDLVAELENQYNVCRAVISSIDENTYTGCPECRRGGFDVEVGEAVYCPSEKCRTTRVLEELNIQNVFLADSSGTIQCGTSQFADINLSMYEVGNMIVASVNKWRPQNDDTDRYTINRMRDISPIAYGTGPITVPTTTVIYNPTDEDYQALERLFAFESDLPDPTDEEIDAMISVYNDVCEFYNEVTPRDLSKLVHMKVDNKKLYPAFKKALDDGIIRFDRSTGLISPHANR